MKRLVERVRAIYGRLEAADWVPRLVARLGVGLMFAGGAVKKVQTLGEFTQYFKELGIPAAEIQAPFVVGVEIVCGIALMIGLLTRPSAVMLAGTMVVAIFTAAIKEKGITASWKGLLEFLYLPEWLLLVILVWLVFTGAGKASVDARHAKRA